MRTVLGAATVAVLWILFGTVGTLVVVGVAVTVGVLLSGVGEEQRQREAWIAAGGKSRMPS